MTAKQFHGTPAHVYQNYQAQIRLSVKLKFLLGIARRITEVNGTTNFPQVREMLGQLAADAATIDAFVAAMEAKGSRHGRYFIPTATPSMRRRRWPSSSTARSSPPCASWPAAA